jgi:tRNA threonylcarbamoyladenosine biosynthesis protein TsaE
MNDAELSGAQADSGQTPTARWVIESADERQTVRLGQALAAALPAGVVVALHGPLGAGKTRLVQAVAEAAGVQRGQVVSPTFVIVQEHFAHGPIWHIDAYRLADAEEFLQLGGQDYLAGPGWTFIEWAERIAPCLPAEMLSIRLEPLDDRRRRIEIEAFGTAPAQALSKLELAYVADRKTS